MLKDLIENLKNQNVGNYLDQTKAKKIVDNIINMSFIEAFKKKVSFQGVREDNMSGKKERTKKNPHFTNVSPRLVTPLKRGDSEADILAKMYNFMFKRREEDTLNSELNEDRTKEREFEEQKRHEKLVEAVNKHLFSFGHIPKEKKKNPILSIIESLAKSVSFLFSTMKGLSKVFANILGLPKKIFQVLGGLGSTLGKGPKKGLFGGAVGGLLLTFPFILDEFKKQYEEDLKKLQEDKEFNKQKLSKEQGVGKIKLKTPGTHAEMDLSISESDRKELSGLYDQLDTEQDQGKIADINDKVLNFFKKILENNPDINNSLELHNIKAFQEKLSADREDILGNVQEKMDEAFKNWIWDDVDSGVKTFYGLDTKPQGGTTSPLQPESSTDVPKTVDEQKIEKDTLINPLPPASETLEEVEVPAIDEEKIHRVWDERDRLSGSTAPYIERQRIINKFKDSKDPNKEVGTFLKSLQRDIDEYRRQGIEPRPISELTESREYNLPQILKEVDSNLGPSVINNSNNNVIGGKSKVVSTTQPTQNNMNITFRNALMNNFSRF